MQRKALIACCCVALATGVTPANAREKIPADYEVGHFFATPSTAKGQRLRLVVDTGGGGAAGLYPLWKKNIEKADIAVTPCGEGEDQVEVAHLAPSVWRGLPVIPGRPCDATALLIDGGSIAGEDGQLGAGYLPHFIWTFDYPDQALWLEDNNWKPSNGMRKVPLGFMENDTGDKLTGFPRVTLTIAGEPIDLLLDTGATAGPTEAGIKATGIDTAGGVGVTSYITTSVLERWHREHPLWRVVENGDHLLGLKARLIEVPKVEIAGWSIGPLWFTERPDRNFGQDFMSRWMDQEIVGAAGANLWQHFVMTLDYPRDAAWLACADCIDVHSK
jgi:hypothetical protein